MKRRRSGWGEVRASERLVVAGITDLIGHLHHPHRDIGSASPVTSPSPSYPQRRKNSNRLRSTSHTRLGSAPPDIPAPVTRSACFRDHVTSLCNAECPPTVMGPPASGSLHAAPTPHYRRSNKFSPAVQITRQFASQAHMRSHYPRTCHPANQQPARSPSRDSRSTRLSTGSPPPPP